MITGKNYIGNNLIGVGDKFHRTINAKLNIENPSNFIEATSKELNQAISLADKAFKIYKNIAGKERASFLNSISDEIMALGNELIEMFTLESGLPEARAIGEISRTVSQLQAFAKMIETEDWKKNIIEMGIHDRKPFPKPDLRKTYIPIGPVVVFAASNFPLAFSTAGGDTASALASGCPVIVKSHSMHSGTGELVASAIIKSVKKIGMPNGVFSNINGRGMSVGQALVKHPKIKAVGFTGSLSGGKALYNIGSQREEPIPVFAEMGSVNPVVISSKSIVSRCEEIANNISESIMLGTGQFCTNPGLLIVIDNEKTISFIKSLADKMIKKGSQCMLHPNIKKNYLTNSEIISNQEGVTIRGKIKGKFDANFVSSQLNTVSGKDFLSNSILHKEVFGPFSLVVKCKDEAELIKVINSLEGQLTGTLFAEKEELKGLEEIIEVFKCKVGRIIFNGVPTGVEVSEAMTHGGPYPASSDSRFTSVGLDAIKRWVRPFTYQDWPTDFLPSGLRL